MSIRFIQSNYGKLDCYNVLRFLLDLTLVNLEDVMPYEQGTRYKKGDFVHLKENYLHKVYRCKVDVSSDTFVPDEWEHAMDIYDEEIKNAEDKNSYIDEKASEYDLLQNSILSAAKRGYIDTIIEPCDTRKYVIGALEMLYTKREERPVKKHGTI